VANIPNFFIVGAAKSGTTSLWMYLKQHPDIFMPEDNRSKEPAFFCNIHGYDDYEQYLSLFDGAADCRAIGEASTAYLTSPESSSLIRAKIPDAKIIVVLRNPVDRAYSLYRWMVNHGYEWISPFEKALEIETVRKNDKSFYSNNPLYYYNYLYFESGLYFKQISRYFKEFQTDQIKVILLEDLSHRPTETVQEIYDFLGVDPNFVPEVKVHNKAELKPVFIKLHSKLRVIQKRRFFSRAGKSLFNLNVNLFKLKWPKMALNTRVFLLEKYRSDIELTQEFLKMDLRHWLK